MLKSEADLDLLKRYATAGDPDAFGEIVRRYTALVYYTCLRVLHNRALAEDASQDTFYRLMNSPGTVNRSVGAWLHRTATRRSLDVLRSDTARIRREREYSNQYYHGRANPPAWSVLSPKIDEALAQLKEPTRSLLVEHFLAGKTQRQIAQETKCSPATVSRRIKQGLHELRQHMDSTGLIVAVVSLTSMLESQTALAAPPQISAELGKMAMVCGDPSALGIGGVSNGGLLLKAGATTMGAAVIGLAIFGLAHIGNGPATVLPPTGQEGTRAAVINQTTAPEALTQADPADATNVYVIPQPDSDFDSQRIVSFQAPTGNPAGLINLGFADGHVEQLRVSEADKRIMTQTGQTMGDLMKTLPMVQPDN